MTAEQVKAQAQAEKLYELDGRLYLHVQPCDGGYDYTIYDKGTMRALDAASWTPRSCPVHRRPENLRDARPGRPVYQVCAPCHD